MNLTEALDRLHRIEKSAGARRERMYLAIPDYVRPGEAMGGIPSVVVKQIHAGIDWDSDKVFLTPISDMVNRERVIANGAYEDTLFLRLINRYGESCVDGGAEIPRARADLMEAVGAANARMSEALKEQERLRQRVAELERENAELKKHSQGV